MAFSITKQVPHGNSHAFQRHRGTSTSSLWTSAPHQALCSCGLMYSFHWTPPGRPRWMRFGNLSTGDETGLESEPRFSVNLYAFFSLHSVTAHGGVYPGGSVVKNPPAKARDTETRVRPLGQEDPLEEEMEAHSSIPAWQIPWPEQSEGLQSLRSQELDTT